MTSAKRLLAPMALLACAALPQAADAAIAGAPASNSTATPDLVSATVLSSGSTGTTVRFCFSKTLSTVTPSVPGGFTIGTYDQGTASATGLTPNGQCLDASFPSVLDATAYTYAGVAASATTSAAGAASLADSTALIGSATNNGTRARSTAPDLVGVALSNQSVAFTFDEALAAAPTLAQASQFSIQDANGATAFTGGAAGSGAPTLSNDRKTVSIDFSPATAANLLSTSMRGTYLGTSIASLSSTDLAPISSAPFPGRSGATALADPQQATLVSDGTTNAIDVLFDQPVSTASSAAFSVLLSNGTSIPATAAAVNGSTVRLTAQLVGIGEYVVGVTVATGATSGPANTIGTVPAGGNAGSFATGYTTAPDVQRVTFDGPTATATITVDQRYGAAQAALIRRVDAAGGLVTDVPTLTFGPTVSPGQTTLQAKFATLTGTRGLSLSAGALTSLLTGGGAMSLNQVTAPFASTAG